MPRTLKIGADTGSKATEALKGVPNSKVQFRLLAIVKAAEKGLKEVAEFLEVHYTTLSTWIRRFEEGGVEALNDKPKGHAPRKLSDQQLEEIGGWLKTQRNGQGESTHWTLEKLRVEIQTQWDISIAIGPLWYHLQRRGYRHKSVRPHHTNQPAPEALDEFKKKRPGDDFDLRPRRRKP